MSKDNDNDMFDAMFDAQVEEMQQEREDDDTEEQEEVTEETSSVLSKFRDYIKSLSFDLKCKRKAKDLGYHNYKIFKNGIIKKILGKIADTFNLTICVIGDVLTYAINFIGHVLTNIIYFSVNICKKIISLLTFNCGTPEPEEA